jgi:uncharacterized protein YceK
MLMRAFTTSAVYPSIIITLLFAGCSSTVRNTISERAPGVETYDYYAVTDDCNCKEYTGQIPGHDIDYSIRANYSIDTTLVTYIEIAFRNNTGEKLKLDPGVVKIVSRNIPYQYNDKFLPLPPLTIQPRSSDHFGLTGKDLHASKNEWNKIAGERLTIVFKGIRLGKKELPEQEVSFVPANPKIKKP